MRVGSSLARGGCAPQGGTECLPGRVVIMFEMSLSQSKSKIEIIFAGGRR